MEIHTTLKAYRIHYIESCLRNNKQDFTKEMILESLNEAIRKEFDTDKQIATRTFNEDWKYIKNALEDNGLSLIKWKKGKLVYYRYSDVDFTINNANISKKEVGKLVDAVKLLQQIKGIDLQEELTDILQKLDAQIKYHRNKDASAIGFQQTQAAVGYQFVDDLYEAIIEQNVVEITYQPFNKEAETKTIHPYHLRQYNNRWFLFGYDEVRNALSTFALDRIVKKPRAVNKSYHPSEGLFDANTFFKNIIGVTHLDDATVEEIKLVFASKRAPYIITKPIHETQQHNMLQDGSLEVNLQLSINNELKQLILSFGADLKVIAPESLKIFIKEQAEMVLRQLT